MVDLRDALHRCKCPTVEWEEVPELPQVQRCKHCRGWVTLRIFSMADLQKVRELFPASDA